MYCCDDVFGYIQIEPLFLLIFLIECFFFLHKKQKNIIQEKMINSFDYVYSIWPAAELNHINDALIFFLLLYIITQVIHSHITKASNSHSLTQSSSICAVLFFFFFFSFFSFFILHSDI
jgi:hypothetical protein